MTYKVLQFFSTLNSGGAENRMMDVYRTIDLNKVMFDFAVVHEGEHYFDKEILENGSKKFILPDPRKGLIKNYFSLVKFFKEHPEYKAVHAHVAWYNGVVLLAAKQAGIPIRISHARDSVFPNRSFKTKMFSDIGKLLIAISATQKLAISKEAAENIYGKRAVKRNDYLFIPNSIDQHKYKVLDCTEKDEIRAKLEIPDGYKAYVNVGNLREQKNHMFLLDIAYSLKKMDEKFLLFLIGEGNLRKQIEAKIKELDLTQNVKLLGSRGDVPKILGAFDGMIFPSFFEGLGGVVLEAQIVGVPAIVSDRIPTMVDVEIDMVEYVSLDTPANEWAKKIIKKVNNYNWDYEDTLKAFSKRGYVIEETAKKYLIEYGIDPKEVSNYVK